MNTASLSRETLHSTYDENIHTETLSWYKSESCSISSIKQALQVNHCIYLNMAVSRHTSKTVICSLLVLVSLAVPVGDVNGFPDNIRTTATDLSSANTSGCITHVNQTYNKSITLRKRSVQVTRTVRETQLVRTCCAGFTNTTSPQPQEVSADDPCGNLTCSSYPDAVCAVVTKCGEKIPVFLNSAGIAVDCGNQVSADDTCSNYLSYSSYAYPDAVCAVMTKCGEKIPVFLNSAGIAVDCGNHKPTEELRTETKCENVCPFDPCLGKTCSRFPNAVCVTTPSDCKPLWLLETGVRVDCSTGEQISPQRAKRQSTKSPTCISFPTAKTFGRNPVGERCWLLDSQAT